MMIPRGSKCHCERVIPLRAGLPSPGGRHVLYWLQTTRRLRHNSALQLAIEIGNELQKPVVVFQALRLDEPFACDRFFKFEIDGLEEMSLKLRAWGIPFYFYLEETRGESADILSRLARQAAAVVTDDFPCSPVPERTNALLDRTKGPVFAVDSNGVVPLRCFSRQEYAARTFRPKYHKFLPRFFNDWKLSVPRHQNPGFELRGPWSKPGRELYGKLAGLPIDHTIAPTSALVGGTAAARQRLKNFLSGAKGYAAKRNDPSAHATSGLSPYLHFGHLSALEAALAARDARDWTREDRNSFLEELLIRRELAFNYVLFNQNYKSFEGLPEWARRTLNAHRADRRKVFSLSALERGGTNDALWNAAQSELVATGKIHGYMRMLWGKKLIEWTRSPEDALETMIYLNDKYALDGRDPNGYAGVQWCLGLHDRPWAPQREIFGMVRFMSTEAAKSKFDWKSYVAEGAQGRFMNV